MRPGFLTALLLVGCGSATADDAPIGWVASPQVVNVMARPLKCQSQPAGAFELDELGKPLPIIDGRAVKCVNDYGHAMTCGKDIFNSLHVRYVCSPIEPKGKAELQRQQMLACDSKQTWVGFLCRWDSR